MSHYIVQVASRSPAIAPSRRLAKEEEENSCSCTGTAIGYGLLGAFLGFAAGWMINDQKKAEIKRGARERAARGAQRVADRLRS